MFEPMEEKIYKILRKHKLSLKKREALMPDLLKLIEENPSKSCLNFGSKERVIDDIVDDLQENARSLDVYAYDVKETHQIIREHLIKVSSPIVNSDLIDYIENDAEIAIPIEELIHENGRRLTKNEYGKVLLKYLAKELREHYC